MTPLVSRVVVATVGLPVVLALVYVGGWWLFALAAIAAVLALAFSVVYLPSRVFYIALAGAYSAVPFVAWECLRRGWTWAARSTLQPIGSSSGQPCSGRSKYSTARPPW